MRPYVGQRTRGWLAALVAGSSFAAGAVLVRAEDPVDFTKPAVDFTKPATEAAKPDASKPKPAKSPGDAVARPKPPKDRLDYIDEMLEVAWSEAKVKPSPIASDAEFMRRLYLDLLGRIPSADEASAFLGSKEDGKRTKLVEYLLASPDYPKHFGTIWTNLLVGRRPMGRQVDRSALANFLRRQFTENKPWNETAYAVLTAAGSNKENGAVNFTLAHMGDGAVNLTSFSTRLFLGQQIQCTQCHDHPSNDWKQADFWGINAFFKGLRSHDEMKTDAAGAEVYDHTVLEDMPTDAYSSYEKRNAVVGVAFPTFLDGRKISQDANVNRREALGKFMTESDNLQFSRAFVNRMWGHFMGRGFVQPVDDFGAQNPPSHEELLDRLAEDFRASGYDVKALIRWITASKAYQLTSLTIKENEKDETLFSHMQLKPMNPEQLFDSLLVATAAHKAGGSADTDRIRDQWMRQFVVAFANDEAEETATFQGTIPQALMMMNGDLMNNATSGKNGSFLAKVYNQAIAQRKLPPPHYMVSRMYLAALGRYPDKRELNQAAAFLGTNPDAVGVLQDLFWSLLNSNEFILNH